MQCQVPRSSVTRRHTVLCCLLQRTPSDPQHLGSCSAVRTLCSLRAALRLRKGRNTTIMVDSIALGRTRMMYLTFFL